MKNVTRRPDHNLQRFWGRTIAAQLHGLGFFLMVSGGAVLLPLARRRGIDHFLACLCFIFTGSLVFLVSSVYHFLNDGYQVSSKLEALLEDLDHFGIYLFIAGTYTPLLLNSISGPWRPALLILIWTIALAGILYTHFKPRLPRVLQSRSVYTGLFILMGFTALIRIGDIWSSLSPLQHVLMVGGAAAYALGAAGYATRRPRLFAGFFGYHELWHIMVLLGAGFHFFFIYSFYSV